MTNEIRVISSAGGAFAITAIPDAVRANPSEIAVDVEFLSPDHQVRYLGRTMYTSFLLLLADFFMACASELLPEQTVATVEDAGAELMVSVLESDEFTVTIEFAIVIDPEEEPTEFDGVALDLRRAALVTAAHAARTMHDARVGR